MLKSECFYMGDRVMRGSSEFICPTRTIRGGIWMLTHGPTERQSSWSTGLLLIRLISGCAKRTVLTLGGYHSYEQS